VRFRDTGERRRASDRPLLISGLIDEETVRSIAQEAWSALVGECEFLVPLPGELPADAGSAWVEAISAWVEVVGPWTGAVVLTCGRSTAEQLSRELLKEHAPSVLDDEDIEDGLGELANVVGGNVKAVLPGPSVLGLPEIGTAPRARADTVRADLLWRGQSLTISVQGSAGALTDPHENHENEVPL
jgi:chemotaxis protein CheX